MSDNRPFDDLRSLGQHLREHVPPVISDQVAAAALRSRRRSGRRRSWIVVLAAAALLAISNVALARATDASVPGDFLYPVDRAYEWLGDRFGETNRLPERVDEALVLAAKGETDLAASLVNEIVRHADHPEFGSVVGQLVEAAQSGSHQDLEAAIAAVKAKATVIAESNRGGAADPASPAVTAPGQVEGSPSDTAPGQVEGSPSDTAPGQGGGNPSDTAPGQVDDPPTDSPSATAPGQITTPSGVPSGRVKEKDKTEVPGSSNAGGGSQGSGQGRSNP
jgi:hypothetical protein